MPHLAPLLLALLAAAAPAAQHDAPDTFGHSRHGAAFDEGPRQAAYLMEGMSAQVHMPIAGLSDEAQRFFDQGLTQLHGFWYFEAERSFRQVAKLHPECGMAYWGMALHGTFLVDGAGRVRWQDISYEPFTELEWLLGECRRLLRLPAPAAVVTH